MRYAKEHKAETRRKILEAAGRLFRERGYDGAGVDEIMAEAGLTAGGFYSHFKSKEALFAEAMAYSHDLRSSKLSSQLKSAGDSSYLQNLIYGYLSRTHRDSVMEGCMFAALTTDVVRGSNETREQYEKRLRQFISTIEAQLSEGSAPEKERAIGILVQLVGGLMLSRAVNDEKLSTEILKACRQAAMKLSEGEGAKR
jgi:TetR/AcrR family transcriptional regulator, transcriptional repressor for nem operon